MVEVQVGEHHVGDVVGCDAVGGEGVEEPAAGVVVVVDLPDPGVDEHRPVAGAQQEPAERELEVAVGVELRGVAGPAVLAGHGEHRAGVLASRAVDDGQDLQVADFHCAPSITAE